MVLTRVALTGASGMLGRHIAAALSEVGSDCLASSRRAPRVLAPNEVWRSWDLADWRTVAELDEIFPDAQAIIHAGCPVPSAGSTISLREFTDAGVRATVCLGHWAQTRKIPFLFISGSIVYADPEREGVRETDPTGCWKTSPDYSLCKLLSESALLGLADQGLELCILRPSSIYGRGIAPTQMVAQFLSTAGSGGTIEVAPPAHDRLNLVHATDVANAALQALSRRATGIYNIAGPETTTIVEIAELCVEVTESGSVRVTDAPATRLPVVRFDLDTTSARIELGIEPGIDLRDGLTRTWTEVLENVNSARLQTC